MKSTPISFRFKGRTTAATLALAAALSLSPVPAIARDLDGDGIANLADPDVDGDGLLNGVDPNVDGGVCRKGPLKGKYVGDRLQNDESGEKDIDGDGFADDSKSELDIDGDGRKDDSLSEKDIDGDGRNDDGARESDIDGDGRGDGKDDDIDGDGTLNGKDDDCDGDGHLRGKDDDDDGDGTSDDRDDDDDNNGVDDHLEVEVSLAATANAPSGSRVRAKIKQLPSGKIELDFDARSLDAGSYDVVINGQVLGQLVMIDDGKRTEGEVDFETNPNKSDELPLPFDPSGLPVKIVANGTDYFTGTVPTPQGGATGGGDDNGGGVPVPVALTPAGGLSSEAEGSAELQFGTSGGVTGFEVEVEGIPAGNYDLVVGGVTRGTLGVVAIKGKLRGKLRFEVSPDKAGELTLDFTVAGESLAISQSGTIFFSGTLPGGE